MESVQTPRGVARLLLLALVFHCGCRCAEPSHVACYLAQVQTPFDASQGPAIPTVEPLAASDSPPPVPTADAPPVADLPREANQKRDPLRLPPELPGADTPPLRLPPHQADETEEQRREVIRGLYPQLPRLAESRTWQVGPQGAPLTLDGLQQMAMDNSPVIQQAAADVEAARGAAIQAGTYPNPEMGYEADTVNTANTDGYHGGFVSQTIITAGKLRLAEAAAAMDIDSAQLALRRARVEVATAVRSMYFEAIVARQRLKLATALSNFTEQIYQVQIELVEGGESAPYEPLQLRVLALQARASVAQAQQQYLAAWRQLAAAIGLPQLPPTELAGSPDRPVPRMDYERALAYMLSNHTNLGIAQNNIAQADFLLQLARVTPIPDLDAGVVVQRDYTFNPGTTTYNLNLGGEIPVFNRNRGNIISSQAQLFRARQGMSQVRNQLTGQLGEAFARYEANRVLAESFRAEALRDQVRTYRGVYQRYHDDPQDIRFNDVVVAQQTLASTLTQYIDVLANQWQAVVDVAELLQVDDIFSMGDPIYVAPIPELGTLDSEQLPVPAAPQLAARQKLGTSSGVSTPADWRWPTWDALIIDPNGRSG